MLKIYLHRYGGDKIKTVATVDTQFALNEMERLFAPAASFDPKMRIISVL